MHDAIGIQTQLGIMEKCYAYAENKKSVEGLRFYEFRDLLSDVFNFNRAVGCIFVASFNKLIVLDFFDELYFVSCVLRCGPMSVE